MDLAADWHPTLNASLNLGAFVCLVVGVRRVKRGDVPGHRNLMLAALGFSVLFLVSYLTYHATSVETRYDGPDWFKPVYFAILISHVPLAALVPWAALRTAWLGYKDDRPRHRRWARWTYPLWLYVSITGVAIWAVLYGLGWGTRAV